ncbi:MAG TPA: hypothetical protein VFS31_12395 [Chitinophagaceae bacterium]|jgi:hypothetical protein|nr:hypothetical protein [Chitinophagaceae bacterium]
MKRILLIFLIAGLVRSANASEPVMSAKDKDQSVCHIEKPPIKVDECTVEMEASLGWNSIYVKVNCSATKASCEEAIAEAMKCVKSGVTQLKKVSL